MFETQRPNILLLEIHLSYKLYTLNTLRIDVMNEPQTIKFNHEPSDLTTNHQI